MSSTSERIRELRILGMPDPGEFGALKRACEFTPEEQAYWDEMERRRDSQVGKKDYGKKAEFYRQELEQVRDRFDGRIAVERRLRYLAGHSYECLGTFLHDLDAERRAEALENAVWWYQQADETVRVSTDYALRQANACLGAASLRRELGRQGETAEWYEQRARQLLETFSGGQPVTIIDINEPGGREIVEALKRTADAREELGVAKAYFHRKKPEN
ncbi:MAG: hypothetical protein HYW25_04490 [Candidatus Aenigmarchaeota archaeon]|nr:hypothetical protein [Candidatus Aenigmarchaeota archaeon]